MTTITVIFHDNAADPVKGLREEVKAIADKAEAQLTQVDPNKVTISGGSLSAVWTALQDVAPIEISHDGSAVEHTALLKAMQDAAKKKKAA